MNTPGDWNRDPLPANANSVSGNRIKAETMPVVFRPATSSKYCQPTSVIAGELTADSMQPGEKVVDIMGDRTGFAHVKRNTGEDDSDA